MYPADINYGTSTNVISQNGQDTAAPGNLHLRSSPGDVPFAYDGYNRTSHAYGVYVGVGDGVNASHENTLSTAYADPSVYNGSHYGLSMANMGYNVDYNSPVQSLKNCTPNATHGPMDYVVANSEGPVKSPLSNYGSGDVQRQNMQSLYYGDNVGRMYGMNSNDCSNRARSNAEDEDDTESLCRSPISNRNYLESDTTLPIANIGRLMKTALPSTAKIAKHAKEMVKDCVTEFIQFIVSEASDKCLTERRKTLSADDIINAIKNLGFVHYIEALRAHHMKWREIRDMGLHLPHEKAEAFLNAEGASIDYEKYALYTSQVMYDNKFEQQ
ncbi:bifunctional Histone-fold/Transcription factor CBF-NF-Y-archaeal histone domain/Transcription factor NFYB-HAP3 [Babesia duncani]|uniref:Bifunctional Histone-fold/Transcription factor CBF-NF-Y-archaeal histone domain/Transcription factor NFYB-HAP3 n=1 Tax=Babesia duncani TaxID=323732 RepID=A0AAD9UM89_9APIC|nr:bifunctional Histone-fold/Transcription factor CBF-NF-Y-archaeal histone domain/Transcription factor NFYB-HAP3 [Babesia duncani]KAK2194753.1 bifunctional Histone-fold/Transcription factor CBF-NF-Y-archaeal histone domain/Transcription factor NFYB-HAP3 [Babesia duncani]KAK2195832.1 bifunctional Histone-fold/Transcription factor CBF-NF-Y-archaeal histone domain/Transcription factor NFYB-HAP3 [Babesia duncani]